MIKGIIFDMDGVLVDTEWIHFQHLVDFLRYHGIEDPEENFYSVVGSSAQRFLTNLASFLGPKVTPEQAGELLSQFEKKHELIIDYPSIFREDVLPLLQEARRANLKVGLASSSRMDSINKVTKACRIQNYFDVLVSGEMFEESKPNPEIYLYTADKLGLKPQECVAVEDSFYGIKAAKCAGLQVIAYEENRFLIDQGQADYLEPNMKMVHQRIRELMKKDWRK